jgi:hypothetical protein
MDPLRHGGPGQSGPLTDASPGSHDRRGLKIIRVVLLAGGRPYTRSLSNRTPVLSWRSSAWVNEPGNVPLARIIERTDLCATARACALARLRDERPVRASQGLSAASG